MMIKRKQITNQKFIKADRLVLAEKLLALIVFAVSVIQLLSRKGARYGLNVLNRYLIIKQESMNMIKNIFG